MSLRDWKIGKVDMLQAMECSKRWNVPEICAAILLARGINDEEVSNFLDMPEHFDPMEFTDMEKAVNIIEFAVKSSQKVCVYGDYDADGITSTALLYNFLKSKGAEVVYYIPNRETEGYGLNLEAVKKLANEDVKLLITVDNGVSAYDEVKLAKELGMKVVITDHHKLPEVLPGADAIVNPCRETWLSKSTDFSGVGVVYKLAEAMGAEESYIDLAVLGTIGDSMPMFGQSRRIVKKGLESIQHSKIKGVKALMDAVGLKSGSFCSTDLAFKAVPRVNASGRIESAQTAIKLFIAEDETECSELCLELENLNSARKEIEKDILKAVEEEIDKNPAKKFENIIIVSGEGWHHGVVGIVASKITDKYGKPSIIISFSGDEARGSCRSVEGFSIYDTILAGKDYLTKFGGHTLAAGINLKTKDIEDFSKMVLRSTASNPPSVPDLFVDLELDIFSFSVATAEALDSLEPFGNGNPEPIFCMNNLRIESIISIGKGGHMKLVFKSGGRRVEMLYFNKPSEEFLFKKGEIVDAAFTLHKNVFRSKVTVSAFIVDVKPSGTDVKTAILQKSIYEKFKRNEKLSENEIFLLRPVREEFAKVYRYILKGGRLRADIMSQKIFGNTLHCGKIYVILDVLEEMNLVKTTWFGDEFKVEVIKSESKVNLEDSEVLKQLNEMKEVS